MPEPESAAHDGRTDSRPSDPRIGATGRSEWGRRRFLGAVGAGAAAGVGIVGTASANETSVVAMGNNHFNPVGLSIEPGATVRFEIVAGTHSATAYENRIPSDATAFDSGIISEGSFEFTFETPGTHDYYCIPHKSVGMVGRIVVGSPGGPAEESPIPDGNVPESDVIVERGTIPNDEFDEALGNSVEGMMGPGMGPEMMNETGGMMGPGMGSEMMNARSGQRRADGIPIVAVGGMLGLLGVGFGTVYWAFRRGTTNSTGDNSSRLLREDEALDVLRSRYVEGEIDEEELEERVGTVIEWSDDAE